MIKKMLLTLCLFFGLFLFLCAGPAQSTILAYNLNVEFSGATSPAGTAPWLTATFDDSVGGDDTVQLTMSAANLAGTEFIDKWYFNFNPERDLGSLTINHDSGARAVAEVKDVDGYKADGDGYFDILFDFENANNGDRFTAGKTAVYTFTYTSAIGVDDFYFGSVGGAKGSFNSAAHIQGIGPAGNLSGWIGNSSPVPEPATLFLFGIGLLGLGGAGRKKFKK